MNTDGIFKHVKDSFCSLWSFKERGQTLEVITPFSTTNFKFISIFITEREDKIIVTDGGWLVSGEYDNPIDIEDDIMTRIFTHYESIYEIKRQQQRNGQIFYYKSTDNIDLIPNLVYDIGSFLSAVASISQIQFEDPAEKAERENFSKMANSFISGVVPINHLRFKRSLGDDYKNVTFNAVVENGQRLKLIKYITGSQLSFFMSNFSRAIVDFEIASNSPFNQYIDKKIALINDISTGYKEDKLYRYTETLEQYTEIPPVKWTNREILATML
ncbi:MAG: hypothetical protein H0W62_01865 [Chitinophagales bacterium]|nr:hypothetical protein [Chitinophagales bacterium]